MCGFMRSLWCLLSFSSLHYRRGCFIPMDYALGYFRYSFHILKTPWFEMILLASTKRKTTENKQPTKQPYSLFNILFYLSLCFAA